MPKASSIVPQLAASTGLKPNPSTEARPFQGRFQELHQPGNDRQHVTILDLESVHLHHGSDVVEHGTIYPGPG